MDIKKIFGSNVREYRKRAKFTQEDLAEKLNISPKHLSNIELGSRFVSAALLDKLAQTLDVPPAALFYSPEVPSHNASDPYSRIDKLISDSADTLASTLKKKIRGEI